MAITRDGTGQRGKESASTRGDEAGGSAAAGAEIPARRTAAEPRITAMRDKRQECMPAKEQPMCQVPLPLASLAGTTR
jgi:hypothetical protein